MYKVFLKSLIITAIFTISILAQVKADDKNILPPPAKGLVAVHFPKLDNLEKDVREQIASFQQSLKDEANSVTSKTAVKLSNSYGTLGQIYQVYQMYEPAKECYTNASAISPKDIRWVYLMGKIFQEEDKFSESVVYYKKAQEIAPKYPATYVNLGNNYYELNLFNIAKDSFNKALELNPNDPSALYGLGQIAYSERDYTSAVSYFEKVLEILPDANRVHYSLALSYRGLKNTEKAKFHISKQGTVGVRPADPLFDGLSELKQGNRLRLLRAKQAIEAGRYAEAEIEYKKVLADEPDDLTALVNYGAVLTQLKKTDEAIKLFEKAVSVNPKNSNARYNLAALLSAQKKHFQAISHLKVILQNDPKDTEARFFLAKELRNANLLQEAQKELLAVYSANPDSEDVLLEGAKLLDQRGEYAQAKTLLENGNTKFPDRGRTAATLAFLLAASPQADLRDGKKALELSLSVYKTTGLSEHGAIVAMSLAELGRCEEAAKLTQQLIDKEEKAKNSSVILKLKNELIRYQKGKPCSIEK